MARQGLYAGAGLALVLCVAVLRPLTKEEAQRLRQKGVDTTLAEMKALAQEVASAWTSEKSGVELIAEQRR